MFSSEHYINCLYICLGLPNQFCGLAKCDSLLVKFLFQVLYGIHRIIVLVLDSLP